MPHISVASGILALIPMMIVFMASPTEANQGPASVARRAWVMGTCLTVTVEANNRETAMNASEAALRAVTEVENRLSTWFDDSELSRLNSSAPGAAFPISPELEADLRDADHWWQETRGAFDPGIASLVEVWDLRGRGRQPSAVELTAARAVTGFGYLNLDPGFARIETAGFGIEEGGFGKGVALREAADAGREAGADCVLLDFGGQIAIGGNCQEFRLDVADPNRRDERIAVLTVRSGSVATSGNSERGLVVNGVTQGHLLDPQTGSPAPTWGSVTVLASDPVAADCLSTALYIMGPKAGGEWLQGRPEIEAVFVERSGEDTRMTATPGLEGRLEVIAGDLTFLQQKQARIKEFRQ